MKKPIVLIAAAAMALSGLSILPAYGDDNAPQQNVAPNAPTLNDSQVKSIEKTLADVTKSALEKDGFSDVISYLSQADAKRLKDDSKNMNVDDLNAAVAQFNQSWNSKYGHDFKIDDVKSAYADAQVYQGDISTQARTAGDTMAPQNGQPAPQANGDTSANDRTARNLATVVLARPSGEHALKLHMSNEGTVMDSWKIDLPPEFKADQLKAALIDRVNKLNSTSAQWPSDEALAQRTASDQILEAIIHAGHSANDDANGAAPQQ